MHTAIYKNRKDVGAIVHTHPIYSICFGVMKKPVKLLSFDGLKAISRGVPIVSYHHPGTPELADAIVKALGRNGYAALIRYHGLVTVERDIESALDLTLGIEKAAKIQFLCQLLGKPEPLNSKLLEDFLEKVGKE
jgi:L-fuculose-phosphate aldolase